MELSSPLWSSIWLCWCSWSDIKFWMILFFSAIWAIISSIYLLIPNGFSEGLAANSSMLGFNWSCTVTSMVLENAYTSKIFYTMLSSKASIRCFSSWRSWDVRRSSCCSLSMIALSLSCCLFSFSSCTATSSWQLLSSFWATAWALSCWGGLEPAFGCLFWFLMFNYPLFVFMLFSRTFFMVDCLLFGDLAYGLVVKGRKWCLGCDVGLTEFTLLFFCYWVDSFFLLMLCSCFLLIFLSWLVETPLEFLARELFFAVWKPLSWSSTRNASFGVAMLFLASTDVLCRVRWFEVLLVTNSVCNLFCISGLPFEL